MNMIKIQLLRVFVRNLILFTLLIPGAVIGSESEPDYQDHLAKTEDAEHTTETGSDNVNQEKSQSEKKQVETLPNMVITENSRSYQVEKSTAGTRFPVELERVPQSIQIITKDLIEDKGIIDLPRLLRNVPSANAGASRLFANGVFGNSVSVRGFPLGVKRNGFRHLYFEDVDASAFSNIERVEILKGPGSAVFGQEGLGGTLNYVTKMPQKEYHAKLRGTYGENDMAIGTWDFTGPIFEDKLSIRLTGEVERSNTFVDFQEIERNNVGGSILWDDGGRFRAYFNAEYHARESFVHPGLPIIGTVLSNGIRRVDRSAYLGEPLEEYLDYDGSIYQAWAEFDINENWTLRPKFQYFQWNGLQNGRRLRGPAEGEPLHIVQRTGRYDFNEHDGEYTGQLELLGKFDTFSVGHQTVFGLEYADYDNVGWWFNHIDVPNVDSLNPINPPRPRNVSSTRLFFANSLKTFAFYFQDMVSVTDRFDILGSVRFEDLDIRTNFCVGPCGPDAKQKFSNVTYQIGGAYRVYGPVSLYAGYGTAIDVDNILGSFTQDGSTFEPEESEQIEVGIKLANDEGLQATLAYFHNTRKNLATTDPTNPDFTIQAGEQTAEGADLELSWQINENLFIQAGYAYIDGEVSKSNNFQKGNRLKDVAEHQANLWVRYMFTEGFFKNFAVASGFNFVGDRAGNLNNFTLGPNGEELDFTLPSYVVMDASASYRWQNFKFELIAQNIMDKKYFTAGNDFIVHPGQARQVYGRIGFEY